MGPITVNAMNPYEQAGRLKKAYELARILYRADVTPDMLPLMSDDDWAKVATAAGVKMPSVETRALVPERLRKLMEPLDLERISA